VYVSTAPDPSSQVSNQHLLAYCTRNTCTGCASKIFFFFCKFTSRDHRYHRNNKKAGYSGLIQKNPY
jgi:hypothetical protein